MEEPCPRKGGCRDCRRSFLCRRKNGGSARLVMVLEEAEQLLLVAQIGAQVQSHALGLFVFQTIIEPLVVAEVEPELLQLRLQVPISFSHKEEVRIYPLDGGDDLSPVLGRRSLP